MHGEDGAIHSEFPPPTQSDSRKPSTSSSTACCHRNAKILFGRVKRGSVQSNLGGVIVQQKRLAKLIVLRFEEYHWYPPALPPPLSSPSRPIQTLLLLLLSSAVPYAVQ